MVSGENVPLSSVVRVLGMMNRLLCPLVGVLRGMSWSSAISMRWLLMRYDHVDFVRGSTMIDEIPI